MVTSTQVELQFSRYSLLTDTRSKRLGLAGLAAKAMNQSFKQAVDRWRAFVLAAQGQGQVRKSYRSRPEWTKTRNKGANTSALDLYKSDLSAKMKANGELDGCDHKDAFGKVHTEALKRWPTETEDMRAYYEAKALECRDAAKTTLPPLQRSTSGRT